MGSLTSVLWDVFVGEPGMVGSPVGEEEIGGLFPLRGVSSPPEFRRNTRDAPAAPSWNPGNVDKLPLEGTSAVWPASCSRV